ncbi:MAG: hypothetical protein Q8R90_06085 [Bacteroidales bacterium]|nr:hypothetical protein [Bacteroidales bacterium]
MKSKVLLIIVVTLLCLSNQSFSQNVKEKRAQADIGVGFFFSESNNGPSLRVSYGYLFNKSLFLGVGTGATLYAAKKGGTNKAPRIPIFLNSKYSLALSQRTSFIVGLETGYRFFSKCGNSNYNAFYAMPKIGVGFKIGKSGKKAINLIAKYSRDRRSDLRTYENQVGAFLELSF